MIIYHIREDDRFISVPLRYIIEPNDMAFNIVKNIHACCLVSIVVHLCPTYLAFPLDCLNIITVTGRPRVST